LQNELSLASNRRDVGAEFEILVEGFSKRSRDRVFGRTSQNKVVVIPAAKKAREGNGGGDGSSCGENGGHKPGENGGNKPGKNGGHKPGENGSHKPGDYVRVRITGCSSATLQGEEV
jgi:tRNA A37 methylthiotransferase MiaB